MCGETGQGAGWGAQRTGERRIWARQTCTGGGRGLWGTKSASGGGPLWEEAVRGALQLRAPMAERRAGRRGSSSPPPMPSPPPPPLSLPLPGVAPSHVELAVEIDASTADLASPLRPPPLPPPPAFGNGNYSASTYVSPSARAAAYAARRTVLAGDYALWLQAPPWSLCCVACACMRACVRAFVVACCV